jgi:hypothetical protein
MSQSEGKSIEYNYLWAVCISPSSKASPYAYANIPEYEEVHSPQHFWSKRLGYALLHLYLLFNLIVKALASEFSNSRCIRNAPRVLLPHRLLDPHPESQTLQSTMGPWKSDMDTAALGTPFCEPLPLWEPLLDGIVVWEGQKGQELPTPFSHSEHPCLARLTLPGEGEVPMRILFCQQTEGAKSPI